MDGFLKPRLERYKRWIHTGKIRYASQIIPVKASMADTQWILPSGQVVDILKQASRPFELDVSVDKYLAALGFSSA